MSTLPETWRKYRSSNGAVVVTVMVALFVDMVVYGIVIPTLPKVVTEQYGLDSSAVGILFASFALGLLIITPVAAHLSDKYQNRKIPMIIGLFGLGLATIMFEAFAVNYTELLIARIAQGISSGISWTIGLGMIADIYPSSQLGAVMSKVLVANTLGFLVGPPLGGFLNDYISPQAPYFFCAGLTFFDLLARLIIKKKTLDDDIKSPTQVIAVYNESNVSLPTSEEHGLGTKSTDDIVPKEHPKIDVIEGEHENVTFLELLSDSQVLVTCFAVVVSAIVFAGIEPTIPLYLKDKFNLSPSEIGFMYIAIIIPNAVSGLIVGPLSDRFGRKNVIALGSLLFGLSCPLLALTDTLALHAISLALFGVTNAIMMIPTLPEMAGFIDQRGGKGYAKCYALYFMSFSVGMVVGPLIAGFLYDHYSFVAQMSIFGSLLLLCSPLIFYFWCIHQRKEDSNVDKKTSI